MNIRSPANECLIYCITAHLLQCNNSDKSIFKNPSRASKYSGHLHLVKRPASKPEGPYAHEEISQLEFLNGVNIFLYTIITQKSDWKKIFTLIREGGNPKASVDKIIPILLVNVNKNLTHAVLITRFHRLIAHFRGLGKNGKILACYKCQLTFRSVLNYKDHLNSCFLNNHGVQRVTLVTEDKKQVCFNKYQHTLPPMLWGVFDLEAKLVTPSASKRGIVVPKRIHKTKTKTDHIHHCWHIHTFFSIKKTK